MEPLSARTEDGLFYLTKVKAFAAFKSAWGAANSPHALATNRKDLLKAGSACLDRFSALISGAPAEFMLQGKLAAG